MACPQGRAREEWISRLGALEDPDERRESFAGHPEWHDSATLDLLHAELIRCLYADPARAMRLAAAAEWAAMLAGDSYSRAVSLRCAAHIHYVSGRYEAALEAYRAAIELLESLGRDREAGRVYFGGLQPLIYLGRYEEAQEWAARARSSFLRHGDHVRLARLDLNLGNILYRQDRYDEALAHYQRARPVLEGTGEPQDLAAVLSNMVICCISLGQFREAVAHYTEARDWCARHSLAPLAAEADYNIAYLHYLRGDYRLAMDLYRISRRHCQEAGDAYHAALCDLDESDMLLDLNMLSDAAGLARSAAAGFLSLGMRYERAKATVNEAVATFRRGDARTAIRLFRAARRLFAQERNEYWPAIIDLYQAVLFEQCGSLQEARRCCERAARVLSGSPLAGKAALCDLVRARLRVAAGAIESARNLLLARMDRIDSPPLLFHFLFALGHTAEAGGEIQPARRFYRAAMEQMENIRRDLWLEELKISYLRDKAVVYEALVRLGLADRNTGSVAEAFALVQQAKSRSLAEMLGGARVPGPFATGEPEDKVEELRRDLNAHHRQLEAASVGPRLRAEKSIPVLRERIQERERQLRRRLAEAGVRRARTGESLTADEIRAALPAGATLVEYFRIGQEIQAWLLTRDEMEHVSFGNLARTRDRLRLLQFQIARLSSGHRYPATLMPSLHASTRMHLRELYDDLIEPIRGRLSGGHLIVAPHGFLHHLPFHALMSAGGRYLIDDFTVSYTPSASVFALCAARAPRTAGASLVLGSPDTAAPRIAEEAQAVAAVLPGAELFLGSRASAEVLRERAAGCRFIHIAAHGFHRRDNPVFSSIRLGGSHLHLFDLHGMSMPAELVTLSGCSTGVSVVSGADELVGLVRGVLSAGARSLLATLWNVNDQSTAIFMTSFYRHLLDARDRVDKAGALRRAMLELRETNPHPYHWAPFALVGEYRFA